MSLRIYTKVGDSGSTSLLGGAKVSKSDLRIEAYGTIDELNSTLGFASDTLAGSLPDFDLSLVRTIQSTLFTAGSLLAADAGARAKMQLPELHSEDVAALENDIDRMTADLPALKNFILPAGHPAVSAFHVARCVCRRAERCCAGLQSNEGELPALVLPYLNRLSDYLFTLARYAGYKLNVKEVLWNKQRR